MVAILAAVPWIVGGITTLIVSHEVSPGKEGREESLRALGDALFGNESAMMEEAEKGAEEDAIPGNITDACSNCEPPECKDLNGKIASSLRQLQKRHAEMVADSMGMKAGGNFGKLGNWDGHLEAYDQRQRNLRKLVRNAKNKGCTVDPEAQRWLDEPPPER